MAEQEPTTSVEYRTIDGIIGYRFGSGGTVQSCWAGAGPHGTYLSDRWRDLKLTPRYAGYPVVNIRRNGGKQRITRVYLLIAEAFLGPRPPGMEIRHLDGNPANSSADNLCYGTKLENEHDKHVHGTRYRGSRHHRAKVDEEAVREIRRLRATGMSVLKLGKRYGLSHVTISNICNRKIWAHVE